MITNYFQDLWEKAEKQGVSKYQIGCAMFGKDKYRLIYLQGRVSKYMQKRHQEINNTIDKLIKQPKGE